MHWYHRVGAVAVASLVLTACGSDGGTAPNVARDLDPAALDEQMTEVSAVYQQPAIASLLGLSGGGMALSASPSIEFDRAGGIAAGARTLLLTGAPDARRALLSVAATDLGTALPAEIHGKTFVWSTDSAKFVLSQQSGAPANGVRFVIPALDDTGAPTSTVVGYLEAVDLSTSDQYHLRGKLVAGSLTIMSYDLTGTGTVSAGHDMSLTGSITDGTHTLTFKLGVDETISGDSYRAVGSYETALSGGRLSSRLSFVDGDLTASDKSWYELTAGATTVRFQNSTVVDEVYGGYTYADTTDVLVNGKLYAISYYDEVLMEYVITRPDGSDLPENELMALMNAESVIYGLLMLSIYVPSVTMEFVAQVGGNVAY